MNLTICTLLRNSVRYSDTFFAQMVALRDLLAKDGGALRIVAVEGDSQDETWEHYHQRAAENSLDFSCLKREHGGREERSFEHLTNRYAELAWCGNGLIEQLTPDDKYVVVAESDIEWEPETIVALAKHLDEYAVAVPMVWFIHKDRNWLYDTWAMRCNSTRFGAHPPYHECLTHGKKLVEIDSGGSVYAVRGDLMRNLRYDERCVVGLCDDIRAMGGKVILDTSLSVTHPKRPYDPPEW